MSSILSNRVQKVKPSATMAVSDKAKELKSQGIQIVSMGSGEPDFDTPANIQKAAVQAIGAGETRYTAADGTPELKKAICEKFKRENGLDYSANEVMVSCGGKQVFYNLCQAILNEGDEVIIPAPYWVSYPDIAILADATPVFIEAGLDQEFKITPDQLEASITPKSKLLVLNSPSNPTGSVYSRSEIIALGEVLERHPHVLTISDDIYEHIRWGEDDFVNIAMACPNLKERVVILNGVSKAYAMTGWRIGYAAGPETVIKAMKKIAGKLRLDLAQFRELEAFAKFASDLDEATAAQITRGRRMVEILKQNQYVPMSTANQVIIIYAASQGYLDDIELESVKEFEVGLLEHFASKAPECIKEIDDTGNIGDDLADKMNKTIEEFKKSF